MALQQLSSDIELWSDFEPEKINVLEYTKSKGKVILVGLPGAFTPT
jgi:peroxiredoxin